MASLFAHWEGVTRPVIGVLHAPPLPGAPRYGGDLSSIYESVRKDSDALAAGHIHGLLLENYGDAPFCPGRVPAEVVAHMTALASDLVRRHGDLPIGISVLRNDGQSALAVAHAVGASFIRVNVLCGARVTDQGIIEGIAYDLLRMRDRLSAEIKIFADVNVKHSRPTGVWNAQSLADEVRDTIHRGLADAIIVTGASTGGAIDDDELKSVKAMAGDAPVFAGSGVTADSLTSLALHADGFIIGSAFRADGKAGHPIDPAAVGPIMAVAAGL